MKRPVVLGFASRAIRPHTRALLSRLAVTMRRPSGLNIALTRQPVSPKLSYQPPVVRFPHARSSVALAVTMR